MEEPNLVSQVTPIEDGNQQVKTSWIEYEEGSEGNIRTDISGGGPFHGCTTLYSIVEQARKGHKLWVHILNHPDHFDL